MELKLEGDRLHLDLNFWEKLWALQFNHSFEIPVAHIRQVSTDPLSDRAFDLRLPGTQVPGILKAGTYYHNGQREFWYVEGDRPYLTLELEDEFYKRLVLSVEQPQTWAAQIAQRLQNVSET